MMYFLHSQRHVRWNSQTWILKLVEECWAESLPPWKASVINITIIFTLPRMNQPTKYLCCCGRLLALVWSQSGLVQCSARIYREIYLDCDINFHLLLLPTFTSIHFMGVVQQKLKSVKLDLCYVFLNSHSFSIPRVCSVFCLSHIFLLTNKQEVDLLAFLS